MLAALPPLRSSQATRGPAEVLTIFGFDALPVPLTPPDESDVPTATHAPPPPTAALGSKRATRTSDAPAAGPSVHATSGLPSAPNVTTGSVVSVLLLDIPPP